MSVHPAAAKRNAPVARRSPLLGPIETTTGTDARSGGGRVVGGNVVGGKVVDARVEVAAGVGGSVVGGTVVLDVVDAVVMATVFVLDLSRWTTAPTTPTAISATSTDWIQSVINEVGSSLPGNGQARSTPM